MQKLFTQPLFIQSPLLPHLHRNLANIVSILGVLPLCLLFSEDAFFLLAPLIVYNNIMDDLDGILAAKLNIRSQFGAHLDNVCDAVAHGVIVLFIGAHFGGLVLMTALGAAAAAIWRSNARLIPGVLNGGSATNELMRHVLFILLLSEAFEFTPVWLLAIAFTMHSISMVLPWDMSGLIRARMSKARYVVLLNVLLVVVCIKPEWSLWLALPFVSVYLFFWCKHASAWLHQIRTVKALKSPSSNASGAL